MKLWLSKDYKIAQKVLLLVAVPLLFQYTFVVILAYLLQQSEHEIMQERHARELISCANGLYTSFVSLGTLVFLYESSERQPAFGDRLIDTFETIPRQLENLRNLAAESPRLQKDKVIVAKLSDDGLSVVSGMKLMLKNPNKSKGLNSPVLALVTRLQSFLSEMKQFVRNQEEKELKNARGKDARMRVVLWLALGLISNTAIAVFLALQFNKDALRRLGFVLENTQLFKSNKDLNPPIAGTDEIALLDSAFHNMAQELKETNARKRELQAMVTHDLRTPLTNIRLSLTTLIEGVAGPLPAKAERVVNSAEKNCSRLIRLINDLLDIEKLESGQFTLLKREQHLALILEAVEDATADFAAEKTIELVFPETTAKVNADGDRIVQVLVNLISNAVKFSENGKTVWVETQTSPETVKISVRDEGRGIPPEALPKLFERFHQVSASDGARGKGTGLGLSISKALVEAHGGNISVASELGKGTTFTIEIPRMPGL